MKIWANCIVHNEENFIWFAIMSVVDFVDKVLVWDTGSTDRTVEIIKEIIKQKGDKVEFKEVGSVDKDEFTRMRQQMLDQSQCDWILILDGDEIWWENSAKMLREKVEKEGNKLDAIVIPFYNAVGDIYHHQSESAGEYKLLGRQGHLTIKAVNRKITGLYWSNPYGQEGLYNGNGVPIQDDRSNRLIFLELPFLHLTHLKRSRASNPKFKYDLGISFSPNFKYPEVLYKERSVIVPAPWTKRSKKYEAISMAKNPLQSLWREAKKLPQI